MMGRLLSKVKYTLPLLPLALGACGTFASPILPTPTAFGAFEELTATAPALKAASPEPTATAEAARQDTDGASRRATPPAAADPQKIAAFQSFIDRLKDEGELPSAAGAIQPLPELDVSWARLNHYDWMTTGEYADTYVLRATLGWSTEESIVNWWNSGCGFVHRLNARGDHYLAYMGLDGYVNQYKNLNGDITPMDRTYFGDVQSGQGNVEITMAAVGDRISVYVDEQPTSQTKDDTLPAGLIGYSIASGTNSGDGISCLWSDVLLWRPSAH